MNKNSPAPLLIFAQNLFIFNKSVVFFLIDVKPAIFV